MEKLIGKTSGTEFKSKINAAKPITERIIKSIGILAIAGLTSITSPSTSRAAENSAKFVQPISGTGAYVEASTSYKIPGVVSGSTFVDFYTGGNGYYGETSLEKKISGKANAKVKIVHANDLFTRVGVGASAVIQTPKWMFAKVGALPVWSDGSKVMGNRATVNYFVMASLPKGITISSYGEWNVAAPGGPQWTYGEVSMTKRIGSVSVGYNPVLKADGDAIPSVEHRLSVEVKF